MPDLVPLLQVPENKVRLCPNCFSEMALEAITEFAGRPREKWKCSRGHVYEIDEFDYADAETRRGVLRQGGSMTVKVRVDYSASFHSIRVKVPRGGGRAVPQTVLKPSVKGIAAGRYGKAD